MNIKAALDLLVLAKNKLSHADYIKIWGEQTGNHIWQQEGNDLLRIWGSGLREDQKKSFVNYLIFREISPQHKPTVNEKQYKQLHTNKMDIKKELKNFAEEYRAEISVNVYNGIINIIQSIEHEEKEDEWRMPKYNLYYLNKKLDTIELSSKQYAKKSAIV